MSFKPTKRETFVSLFVGLNQSVFNAFYCLWMASVWITFLLGEPATLS